jgi:PadR family transcriptional regulator PadR
VSRTPPELLQGTVDLLILRALTWNDMHGYAISRWILERSGDSLSIEGAALYQALHRLQRQKLVSSEWGMSENNRKARFYSVTPAGRVRLRGDSDRWRAYADAVTRVLRPA